MPDLHKLIVEYLEEQKLMQLATISESGPWICTVWQAFDENLNVYFFSATSRQHSKDIEKDNRVACTLSKPHSISDKPRAVQFSGTAQLLTIDKDIKKARSVYEDRIFNGEVINSLINNPDRPHAFYKITPNKFVLFDTVNYPDNSRQELKL